MARLHRATQLVQRGRAALRGFTIIEVLVVVAVLGITLSLVGPSMLQIIQVQRLRGIHAQLNTDLQFARSEAVRLKVPVHVAVWPAGAGSSACYIVFSDSVAARPFSATCDCRQAAGSRCPAATTQEIKTVVLEGWTGVDLKALQDSRTAIDPFSGTVIVTKDDNGNTTGTALEVEASLDNSRVLRTVMDLGGVVRGCSPAASSVKTVPCS